jgi:phosphohistidine phosphatase
MKRLFIIRHAKSSWSQPDLDDFYRPLNKRGQKDGPEMARRLGNLGVCPDLIVASPAKRASKTAKFMADGTGYDPEKIRYIDELYLGSLSVHLQLLAELFKEVDTLFLVGHNDALTTLAEYLSGKNIGNIPTCGIVALEYAEDHGFTTIAGMGRLLFFWFPKDQR